jgi:pimeloyl-ACP methyl ester carboxylesterase
MAALLIHDHGDPDVPYRNAEEIAAAWPGARVLATEGLGHRAVLRDPAVVRSAVAFLTRASAR